MDLALRRIAKGYLPYDIDQRPLLPPDIRDWLPEGHLALFLLDVVAELDLSKIYAVYDAKDARGRAGYHPAMILALLLYGYCTGKASSRRIERATYEEVAFRVLAGDQILTTTASRTFGSVISHRDRRHEGEGERVEAQGDELRADERGREEAFRRGDSSSGRGRARGSEEDVLHGKGKHGDELPKELKRREDRLLKIAKPKRSSSARRKRRPLRSFPKPKPSVRSASG